MFEGEKTYVFWIGLIILSLASVSLSTIIVGIILYLYFPIRGNTVPLRSGSAEERFMHDLIIKTNVTHSEGIILGTS